MSGMNFLERLLDGVAVEWKTVSEIFHLKNGYTPSKSKNEFWENNSVKLKILSSELLLQINYMKDYMHQETFK